MQARPIVLMPDPRDAEGTFQTLAPSGCVLFHEVEASLSACREAFPALVLVWSARGDGPVEAFLRVLTTDLPLIVHRTAIVADDPDAALQRLAYEVGVRMMWPATQVVDHFTRWKEDPALAAGQDADAHALCQTLLGAYQRRDAAALDAACKALIPSAREDARVAYLLGLVTAARSDLAGAEKLFAHARALNRYFIPAAARLAGTQVRNGKHAEARTLLVELDGLAQGRDPVLKSDLAECHFAVGDTAAAEACLTALSALPGGERFAGRLRIRVALGAGDVDAAIAHIKTIKECDENQAAWLAERGVDLVKSGAGAQGIAFYEAAYAIAPASFKARLSYNIGLAFFKQGDKAKAAQHFTRAEKESIDPKWDKARAALASLAKGA